MTRSLPVALVVLAGVLIVGCTATETSPMPTPSVSPTATPTPAQTEAAASEPEPAPAPIDEGPVPIDQLVLTPDGLDGAVVGGSVPADLAVWDPQGCRTESNSMLFESYAIDDPIWGAFIPVYPPEIVSKDGYDYEVYPFEIFPEADGMIRSIAVRTSTIPTDRGIRVGSSEEEVLAAYPDASKFDKWGAGMYLSYNVDGSSGRLVIEVAGRGFDESQPKEVWSMYLVPAGGELFSRGASDGFGLCNLQS